MTDTALSFERAHPAPRAAATQRPPNARAILAGLLIMGGFFGALGGWAALAPLASAVAASGKLVVESHRKTVQHLEGGIVRAILVHEGDHVAAGQLLIQLDDTRAVATLDQLRRDRDALAAQEARLVAERDGGSAIAFPPSLTTRRDEPSVREHLAGEEAIFASRRQALDGQVDILRQRVAELRSEIDSFRAQVASFDAQAALFRAEIRDVQGLVAKGLERRSRLFELQRDAANVEGSRGQQLGLIAKAEQTIGESLMQMADLRNKRASEVAADLREVQTKRGEIDEKIRAAADVEARTAVVAPQSGVVVDLRQYTPGGIIKAGEPILDIVPRDDTLLVEAQVQPQDIEGVHTGLPAQVRLPGLKQRRTPTLDGRLVYVSADALSNDRTGQSYYLARVEVPAEQVARLAGVTLQPGMPAETLIATGERTLLRYLLDPVRDSFWRSLHEK